MPTDETRRLRFSEKSAALSSEEATSLNNRICLRGNVYNLV